jgi:hypothetical protein
MLNFCAYTNKKTVIVFPVRRRYKRAQMNIELSQREAKLLRTLVRDDLESLLELSAGEKLESFYQNEYAELYQLAQKLGTRLYAYPEQLLVSAEDFRQEEEFANAQRFNPIYKKFAAELMAHWAARSKNLDRQ